MGIEGTALEQIKNSVSQFVEKTKKEYVNKKIIRAPHTKQYSCAMLTLYGHNTCAQLYVQLYVQLFFAVCGRHTNYMGATCSIFC